MSDINIHGVPVAGGGYSLTGKYVMVHDQSAPLSASTVMVLASILASGGVPSEVYEFANLAGFPGTGVTDTIYIAADTNFIYRWDGAAYVQIGGGGGTQDLQAVTDVGNTTNNSLLVAADDHFIQVTSLSNTSDVQIGNSSTDGGYLRVTNLLAKSSSLFNLNNTADRINQMPNASGTLALSVNGNFADAAGNITVSTSGSAGYAAPMWKVDDGDMTAGLFTFTSAALIGATEMNFIIVNKMIEFIDDDFTFDDTTGEITRINQWVAGDKMITPYKPA